MTPTRLTSRPAVRAAGRAVAHGIMLASLIAAGLTSGHLTRDGALIVVGAYNYALALQRVMGGGRR